MRRTTRPVLIAVLTAALLIPATAALAWPDRCADAPESDFVDRDEAREAHRRSIDCVDHTNITSGREEDGQRFYAPMENVTRAQMATFIIQTLEAAGYGDELPSGEATEDDPDEFEDIKESVHRERINQLARIGVAKGVDEKNYAPGRSINRQQMASFIVAATEFALMADYEADGDHFSDVGPRNVHFDNINAGYEEGLFSGTTAPREGVENSGRFSPAVNVRRDQMATFLTKLLDRIEK